MSALDKEKIYEELRNYHTEQLPKEIKSPILNKLKTEFNDMEDRIVSMILSLISGKAEYIDSTKELTTLQTKVESSADAEDEPSRNVFVSKIIRLSGIMNLAKGADFKLKTVRGVKAA